MTLRTLQIAAYQHFRSLTKAHISISILLAIHFFGVIGIATATFNGFFLLLTPFSLIASLGIVLLNHDQWTRSFLWLSLSCFSIGIACEIIGVHTGVIFGNYTYGKTLGWKFADVPVVIGVNWLMLIYAAAAVINAWNPHLYWVLKAAASAALMVGLDFLIEPVAIRYDFWSWSNGKIPFQNYLAWFVISFFLLCFMHRTILVKNKTAVALFVAQSLFFTLLHFF